jgi:hypothetical protein
MQSASVHQSRGKFLLSKLNGKSKVEILSTSFIGEDSKTKIFEHLENLLSLGERKISGRGATTAVGSVVGKKIGPLDQRLEEQRRA